MLQSLWPQPDEERKEEGREEMERKLEGEKAGGGGGKGAEIRHTKREQEEEGFFGGEQLIKVNQKNFKEKEQWVNTMHTQCHQVLLLGGSCTPC